MPDVLFASQAYEQNDYGLPPEECVNMFAAPGAAGDTNEPYALIPREGKLEFADTGEQFCQGAFQKDGIASSNIISVHSTRVYKTDKFGVSTYIGAIDLPFGPVRFAAIRNAIGILSASGNVFRTDGSVVSKITDADLPTPVQDIAAMDQRFIFAIKGDDQFYWSEVLQGDDIQGLSFATAEREADEIVAVHRSHQELWIMGTEICEAWQGTGGVTENAFQPIAGAVMERGCLARGAVLNADNSLFFIGDNAIVYRIGGGYVPERVSTYAIEERISAEVDKGNTSQIVAWSYTRGGHEHIGFRLPTEGTFVYNASTRRWWEARTWNEPTYQQYFALRAFNRVITGDVDSGKLAYLDPKTFTDLGATIERVATANTPVQERTPAASFRVNVVEGQGLQSGQGSDPEIMLDFSDDGEGQTWAKERRLSIGKVGKYAKRVISYLLGEMAPPGRIWRVRITDPVNFTLRKAVLNGDDP